MPFKTERNAALGVPASLGTPSGFIDTVAALPIGTEVQMVDETQGPGLFIYLPGCAATVAGDLCVYDLTPGAQLTARLTKDTNNNSGRSVVVALAATVAGTFGWYQRQGVAIVSAVAATVAGPMFASATAGQISSVADPGDQIIGGRISTAVGTPAAGKCYVSLNRPIMQSQIT